MVMLGRANSRMKDETSKKPLASQGPSTHGYFSFAVPL
jgi:hypothetical protein